MTLAPQVDPEKGIVEDLLLYLVADNNQAQYARSFDSFAIWVDNSLDLYKVLTDHASTVDFSGCCDSDQPIDCSLQRDTRAINAWARHGYANVGSAALMCKRAEQCE